MDDPNGDSSPQQEDTAGGSVGPGASGNDDALTRCEPGVGDCPEGFKCQPYAEPGESIVLLTQCVPVEGSKKHGEACTREQYNDDCGKDLLCIAGTSAKTGAGTCNQLCDGDNPDSCVDKGLAPATCHSWNGGALPLCEQACHPLRPECSTAEGCYPGQPEFVCALPDAPAGTGRPGDDCYTVQSCNPGLACVAGGNVHGCVSDACCAMYCDLDGDGIECLAPTRCVPFPGLGENASPALADVGACVIPDSE